MLKILIAADGGCSGNGTSESIGGWGAVILCNGFEIELNGAFAPATNNQAELLAVINAIEFLKEPCCIEVVSDSQYVCRGYNEWIQGWIKNGWVNSNKDPVKNKQLWERLLGSVKSGGHRVEAKGFKWVKGHAGHHLNERVDQLATQAIKEFKNRLT